MRLKQISMYKCGKIIIVNYSKPSNLAQFKLLIKQVNSKMSIFAVEEKPYHEDQPAHISKAEKFRLEIRKRQQGEKFAAIRQQFIQSLNQLSFLQELKNEKDNLNLQKIQWLISGLKEGKNVASFYQTVSDMNLEPYLCQLVLNKEISLQNRCKILLSLVQLLYFSAKIPQDFIQSNIIDGLRIQLNQINLVSNQVQQDFVFFVSVLVLNLTNFLNESFNLHMIDSDFLPTLQNVLEKSQFKYKNDGLADNQIEEIRVNVLKIYSNLFLSKVGSMKYVSITLEKIVMDERNKKSQQLICRVLNCMVSAAKIPNFWRYQQKQRFYQLDSINEGTVQIMNLIEAKFSPFAFGLLIEFFNELLSENQCQLYDQVFQYIFNDRDFLLKCIRNLQQNEQKTVCKRSMCKVVKLISRLERLDGVIYRNALQRNQFLSSIMKNYVVQNKNYVRYLLRILIAVLDQAKISIDQLINNGITCVIRDTLNQSQYLEEEDLILLMDLVQKMIIIEEELRDKSEGDGVNKILTSFQSKGFIRDIQKLQDHKTIQVYKRSQSFMRKIAQIAQSRK